MAFPLSLQAAFSSYNDSFWRRPWFGHGQAFRKLEALHDQPSDAETSLFAIWQCFQGQAAWRSSTLYPKLIS